MKKGISWQAYELSPEAVEEISQRISDYMEELKCDSKAVIRVRFTVEEMLLRILDRTKESVVKVELGLGKRMRRQMLYIRYDGDELDPTGTEEDDEWSAGILEGLGLFPTWSYKGKTNWISLILKQPGKRNSLISILIAVLLAVIVGLAGHLLSDGSRAELDEAIFQPIMPAFLGLLNTFAGFMIALTIANGILGMGSSRQVGIIGKKILFRYVFLSFIVALITIVVMFPLFDLDFSLGAEGGMTQVKSISEMLFNILPKDPLTPFISGNTIQVIVISIFVGLALVLLDDKVIKIRSLVEEGCVLLQRLTSMVCSLIPIFVFAALVHQIWTGDVSTFIGLWKPFLFSVAIVILFALISLLGVSRKLKVSPVVLMKKFFPAFFTALTTASSISAFSKSMDALGNKCGVDKSLINFSYPIGGVIYMPSTVAELCVLSYSMAELYDVKVSLAWIILALLTSVLLAIAAPPLPGAAMMIYAILFAQLGIPEGALLLAAAMDIIYDYFSSGFNILFLLIENVDCGERLGKVDREKLVSRV